MSAGESNPIKFNRANSCHTQTLLPVSTILSHCPHWYHVEIWLFISLFDAAWVVWKCVKSFTYIWVIVNTWKISGRHQVFSAMYRESTHDKGVILWRRGPSLQRSFRQTCEKKEILAGVKKVNSFQLANRFLDQLNNPPENKAHIGVASLCSESGGLVAPTMVRPLGRYTLYFHRILHTPCKWSQSILSPTTTPQKPKFINFLRRLCHPRNLKFS